MSRTCEERVAAAAGGRLTAQEVDDILERVAFMGQRLKAEGPILALDRELPREVLWSHDDEARFLRACAGDVAGLREGDLAFATEYGPALAEAYVLAVYTAQRECDLLTWAWTAWDGRDLRIRQSKTGRRLIIPATEQLRLMLERSTRRSALILTRPNGLPWREDHLRHAFARMRALAGIKGKWFSDLRRTAIVRLAEAGCTPQETSAISGHDIDYCQKIIDTYCPRTRRMAERAVLKLERETRFGRATHPDALALESTRLQPDERSRGAGWP